MSTPTRTRWRPMPAHPGYEINSSGWVRNERGYVVASGLAVTLTIGGARVRLSRKRLLDVAAEVFGLPAPVAAPSKRSKPGRAAPEASQAEPEHVAEPEPEPAPEALPVPAEAPALVEASTPPAPQKRTNQRHARSGREFGDRAELRINPTRVLPLRDPWADGRIEVDNQWALQGVM